MTRAQGELYPEVVDDLENEGGVPSRLIKTESAPKGGERKARQWWMFARFRSRSPAGRSRSRSTILAREGARRMIATALRAEADEYVARFDDDLDEDGHRLVVRNGRARERKVTVGVGDRPGPRAARQRQARRRGDRRAPAVLLEDPAGVRAPVAEGHRGAADPVPARPVDRRLPAGARGSAGRGRLRPVAVDDQPAVQGVGDSPRPVPQAASRLQPLRLPVRRRGARVRPPRRGPEAVPAGRDWRARGRREGAAGSRGRLPRVHRLLGGRVPRHEAPRS